MKRGSSTRAWLRRERAREHAAAVAPAERFVRAWKTSKVPTPAIGEIVSRTLP